MPVKTEFGFVLGCLSLLTTIGLTGCRNKTAEYLSRCGMQEDIGLLIEKLTSASIYNGLG